MNPKKRVVVLVPFRADQDGWREAAFNLVLPQIKKLGLPYYVGDSTDEPFSIGRTWNHLSDMADMDGRWDVAIRWAADMMISDLGSVERAVQTVHYYTRPFNLGVRLTASETHQLWLTGEIPKRRERAPYGGISINSREMWDKVGGFDPRFLGWGHEDRAFLHGVELHYGRGERVPGRLIVLWHPHRKRGEHDLDDPYWQQRSTNLAILRTVQKITTPKDWASYLRTRTNGLHI